MKQTAQFAFGLSLAVIASFSCSMVWSMMLLIGHESYASATVFFVLFGSSALICTWGAFCRYLIAFGAGPMESGFSAHQIRSQHLSPL
jgi:hypothetical protein